MNPRIRTLRNLLLIPIFTALAATARGEQPHILYIDSGDHGWNIACPCCLVTQDIELNGIAPSKSE